MSSAPPAVREPEASAQSVLGSDGVTVLPEDAPRPGAAEDALFAALDEDLPSYRESKTFGMEYTDTLQMLVDTVRASVQDSRDPLYAARYWAYHLGRSGFFLLQQAALYGSLLATNSEAVSSGSKRGIRPEAMAKSAPRLLSESVRAFAQDLRAIDRGDYKGPYDMEDLRHRQFNPAFIASGLLRFVREGRATLERDARGQPDALWASLDSRLYPDYYKTFHYQTDGWMSSESARAYEVTTETLFLGRQDAMQRGTFVPLRRHLDRLRAAGRPTMGLDLLEVACGTGRFFTFTLDAFGESLSSATALELSPFYLERARANVDYARGLRGWASPRHVRFVQGNAEAMPVADGSADVVTCVYLFHELPLESRRAVAAEMARALRPGGLLVVTDSLQRGDRPEWDPTLVNFENLNEPHYRSYVTDSLTDLFVEAGLSPDWKGIRSASKTLSFTKPKAGE